MMQVTVYDMDGKEVGYLSPGPASGFISAYTISGRHVAQYNVAYNTTTKNSGGESLRGDMLNMCLILEAQKKS